MSAVPAQQLLDLVTAALAPAGKSVAAFVARLVTDAEARGQHRFGLRLLDELPTGSHAELASRLRIDESELAVRGATLTADLAGKFAPAAIAALIEPARRLASVHGLGLVRLQSIGKLGRLAPYVEAVAQAGAIGVLSVSSPSFVAPHGGSRAVLGTNPFAVGVPADGHPIVVDAASSAITVARWHDARAGTATVPVGALIDADAQPTTDPHLAVAIAARGGQFGTSIGIAVEALVAAVTGQLSDAHGAPRAGVLLVVEAADTATETGSELASRLAAAGGHVPGRPIDWPETLEVDPSYLRRLHQLAALN